MTERLLDLPLEDVLGDRFGRYSKYIIQERALPDARDGLKPVQRRILYAMYAEGNTFDKAFRKSAKTVGNVIGNYHPHGDSSVYEAMVRMSQDFKVRNVLIEMHGNNGSLDGDPPAAMRYTEARLSAIASELLRDIDKDTVEFTTNFDDSMKEPVVLPAMFPNLLVNGSTGISAGYATDIPPHSLGEVIEAVIMRIDDSTCTVDRLMTVLTGPDFPTGGIVQGKDGIKNAYETGKGKIMIRSRAHTETVKTKQQIIVTEIPYEINKATLVKKIDELRIDRKLDNILEVRDETDRTGLRIVIDLKKDADAEAILNYLYKNTDLQVPYSFNMVAIMNHRPKQLSLPELLDAYISHQKEVFTNRTTYDLNKTKDRLEIVAGLMKALSILDKVIATIRSANDKKDAKEKIIVAYGFTEVQAEAIVSLQLYKLTNTDITALREEETQLVKKQAELTEILESEKKLMSVMKQELRKLKKTYSDPRRTTIEAEIVEIKINKELIIPIEDVVVTVTKDGYIKRTSQRSYSASNGQDLGMKETDVILAKYDMKTTDVLLVFTNRGSYMFIPVHTLPDIRWKDIGHHVSQIFSLDREEQIINALHITDFSAPLFVTSVTKYGMVKRTELQSYQVQRYSRPLVAMNIREEDEVLHVSLSDGFNHLVLITKNGQALRFNEQQINVVGVRAGGVKGISLKETDEVVSVIFCTNEDTRSILVITTRGAVKKIAMREFTLDERAKRGVMLIRALKGVPHQIFQAVSVTDENIVQIRSTKGTFYSLIVSQCKNRDLQRNADYVVETYAYEHETEGMITMVRVE